MCGRFQISKFVDDIQIRFHVDVESEWIGQIFNAAPMMHLPVILHPSHEHHWLDLQTPVDEALSFLTPYQASDMKSYRVSEKVNKVSNNTPDLEIPLVLDL